MRTATFALLLGIAYLAAGLLGLVPAALMPPPEQAPATTFAVLYGYLLGLFPVNLLHTAFHLVIGLWGVAAWSGAANAAGYTRSLAVIFGLLAILGVIPGVNTLFGMVPLHGHDVWLHGGTALLAAYFGWRQRAIDAERREGAVERRERVTGVALDRRSGLPDRRGGYSPAWE